MTSKPQSLTLAKQIRRGVLAGLLLLAGAAIADADGTMAERTLTAADKTRLARFDESRSAAIAAARAGGSKADLATLDTVLAGAPQPILGVDIRGSYRCRTVKLGGALPLTVYGWFTCRIDEDDLGYRLVKTSGSQRFSGHFIDDSEKRLLFYGAGHYADEKPRAYKADAERDMVGYFVKAGAGRYRLELPLPKLESQFDIIEMVKK